MGGHGNLTFPSARASIGTVAQTRAGRRSGCPGGGRPSKAHWPWKANATSTVKSNWTTSLGRHTSLREECTSTAANDMLCMFTPSWISTTEPRPLTKFGMQLQHQLLIFLDGGILKEDLSGAQLQAAEQL